MRPHLPGEQIRLRLLTAFAPATHGHDDTTAQAEAARARMAAADTKIAQYKAALDAGGDPSIIGPWISQTQAQRATPKPNSTPPAHRAA